MEQRTQGSRASYESKVPVWITRVRSSDEGRVLVWTFRRGQRSPHLFRAGEEVRARVGQDARRPLRLGVDSLGPTRLLHASGETTAKATLQQRFAQDRRFLLLGEDAEVKVSGFRGSLHLA